MFHEDLGDEIGTTIGTLKFHNERRRAPRRTVSGAAMAVFASGKAAGALTRVELCDASYTGIGVLSPIEVEPGTSCSIIPEQAMSPRQIGIVIRCEKCPSGWTLGIQCRAAKAAA
jgi:hypothetical protein